MPFTAGDRVLYTGRWGADRPAKVVRLDRTVIESGQRLVRWIVHLDGVGNVHATDAMLTPVPTDEPESKPRRTRKPKADETPAEQDAE